MTGWTQQVSYDGRLSPVRPVQFAVPPGSVLGPLFFVLYNADLSQVIVSHGLQLHQFTDDCQVCVKTSVDEDALAVDRLTECIADVGTMDELELATSPLVQDPGDVAGSQEPD